MAAGTARGDPWVSALRGEAEGSTGVLLGTAGCAQTGQCAKATDVQEGVVAVFLGLEKMFSRIGGKASTKIQRQFFKYIVSFQKVRFLWGPQHTFHCLREASEFLLCRVKVRYGGTF